MTSRTLFIAAALAVFATPALAQSLTAKTPAANRTATLTKSDEEFLTEMPIGKFPGKEEMADRDNDGIVDSEQVPGGIPSPFPSPYEEKPKVTYTYKPQSSTSLRRVIKDDRIEDGYVQGYMQQTGPKE